MRKNKLKRKYKLITYNPRSNQKGTLLWQMNWFRSTKTENSVPDGIRGESSSEL